MASDAPRDAGQAQLAPERSEDIPAVGPAIEIPGYRADGTYDRRFSVIQAMDHFCKKTVFAGTGTANPCIFLINVQVAWVTMNALEVIEDTKKYTRREARKALRRGAPPEMIPVGYSVLDLPLQREQAYVFVVSDVATMYLGGIIYNAI